MSETVSDKHFIDWEQYVFGYGYGSGESHIFSAIKALFESLDSEHSGYQSTHLESLLGPQAAWLLINVLCKADILEYGTSPRNGWLTHDKGYSLREYMRDKDVDRLCGIVGGRTQETDYCEPYICSCAGRPCRNPLFGNYDNPHREWTQRRTR